MEETAQEDVFSLLAGVPYKIEAFRVFNFRLCPEQQLVAALIMLSYAATGRWRLF